MNQNEIAKKIGVSQAAVSLVMNNPSTTRVSKEKKRAIVEYLRKSSEMNRFSLKKTWNLGYVVDPLQDIRQDFYEKALVGIETSAAAVYYNVIIESYRGTELTMLRHGKVDGMIIRSGKAWEGLRNVHLRKAVVLLNCATPILECDVVMPDNRGGVFKAVEYLKQKGCRKIAFLGGDPDYSRYSCNYAERRVAFPFACRWYGVKGMEGVIAETVSHEALGAVKTLLNRWRMMKEPPDGIVAVNHLYGAMAFSLLPTIPVVACDNKIEKNFPGEGMAMLVQNAYRMGELATELLFQRLAASSSPYVRLDCELTLALGERE